MIECVQRPRPDAARVVRSARAAASFPLTACAAAAEVSATEMGAVLRGLVERGLCGVAAVADPDKVQRAVLGGRLERRRWPALARWSMSSSHIRRFGDARHPAARRRALVTAARSDSLTERATAAKDPDFPFGIAARWVFQDHWSDREASASCQRIPDLLLGVLVRDEEFEVRCAAAAAAARRCRSELVERFASDDDWRVREAVASVPDTPLAVQRALSTDPDLSVRAAAATRHAWPRRGSR